MSASANTRSNMMLVLISVILLAGSITLGYFLFREDKEEKTYLKVEEVYFFQKDLGDFESSIDIIILISNTGKTDVSKVSVRSFAIETDSNLAQYDASIVLINVKGKTTVEGRMSIIVPNGDAYRVELLIFKDDRLTIMGYGNIDLTGVGIVSEYQDVDTGDDDSRAYGLADEPMSSDAAGLGICLFVMVLAAAIIALIVIISVYASKRSGQVEPPAEESEMKFITLEPPVDEKKDHETEEIRRADPLDMLAEHKEEDEKEEKTEDKEKRDKGNILNTPVS